ncbi:hypothetical protein EVAR_6182_1 [Eumeta japonica]|uniref:Uncharacterized protein n=1 Tax=Eumeta variegata TaxID=151549 RepID=A0A4C1TEB4_EUMVA|nr:hypothetical protein EVAR_6182_1 [Eumeta japonica]
MTSHIRSIRSTAKDIASSFPITKFLETGGVFFFCICPAAFAIRYGSKSPLLRKSPHDWHGFARAGWSYRRASARTLTALRRYPIVTRVRPRHRFYRCGARFVHNAYGATVRPPSPGDARCGQGGKTTRRDHDAGDVTKAVYKSFLTPGDSRRAGT